ncbi:hypothetical protein ABTX60_14625 [Streptomyces sp. NPDC126510]|uniref:hypothetical protein n=1 Tax=Streptomyces sp. NPDC126510 TaxID=3155317 RepID=UPI00331CD4AE
MTTTTELTLFADYFRIHVTDANTDGDLSDAWTTWPAAQAPARIIKRWSRTGGEFDA